ncbi:hypothetical protein CDIK_3331 [Cucumispora dikerogammari]|nr:hypothetical protein CDIK_3331 [Cucumispora dikerogammari]
MLALVYNLSILSSKQKASEEEWINANIIKCLDINREFVESPKTSNFCTYKLNFRHEETKCVLSVDLNIQYPSNSRYNLVFSGELVKCTESIGMNGVENDYRIMFDIEEDIYYLVKHCSGAYDCGLYFYKAELYTEVNLKQKRKQNKSVFTRDSSLYIEDWNKTKSITQFRKVLGIEGDRIKTSKFEFIFYMTIEDLNDGKFKSIVMETIPFSFNKNEDGTLVLLKEEKPQSCAKAKNTKH